MEWKQERTEVNLRDDEMRKTLISENIIHRRKKGAHSLIFQELYGFMRYTRLEKKIFLSNLYYKRQTPFLLH